METDSDTESEEEIIYAKPRKSIKTPKKVYILKKKEIEIEESSDEKPIVKAKNFKSQQNKKSVIKVSEPTERFYPRNYFCD